MRKKFFAMYALVGALVASPVFTSCIDGEESASVTAVRNAKAAQIKATADYDAKMNEVNLALKQLELETNQLALEQNKVEFDKVKSEVEAAIAEAKYNTANYTQLMYGAQDGILTELTDNYTSALTNIVTTKESIFNKNADIAALENGIVSIQEYVAEKTEEYNEAIAAAEAKIEFWKDAEGGVNHAEIDAEIKNLEAEIEKLQAAQTALNVEYGDFEIGYFVGSYFDWMDGQTKKENEWFTTDLYTNYGKSNLATINAARKLKKLEEATAEWDEITIVTGQDENGTDITRKQRVMVQESDYNFIERDYDGYIYLNQESVEKYKQEECGDAAETLELLKGKLADDEAALGTEADKADTKYQYDDTHLALTKYAELAAAKATFAAAEKAYTEKKAAYDKAKAAHDPKKTAENEALNVKDAAYEDLTEAQDALANNTDDTKTEALTAAVAAAQKAYDAAEDAYEAAQKVTEPLKKAMDDAYAVYQPTIQPYEDAETAVEAAELVIAQAIDEINSTKWSIAYYETQAAIDAEFETYIAAFEGEDYAAYKAAKDALAAKSKEISEIRAEKSALEELKACKDIDALIAKAEKEIEDNKGYLAKLEEYTAYVPGTNGYNQSYTEAEIEFIISLVKEQIANLEIKLALYEKQAEQAKAALDAYLGTEEEA